MKATPPTAVRRYVQPYRYPSPNIPRSAIRRFARLIADKFKPQKIILFGSYAYGTPHEESDVDLLVIMQTPNPITQAIRINLAFERPFSLDLIVRTPKQIERGLRPDDFDWFLREIVGKGIVLYEEPHQAMGSEGRGGLQGGNKPGRAGKATPKHRLLPLPASGRKIPQGATARTRGASTANPRPRRPS